jgi:hypothetical protein
VPTVGLGQWLWRQRCVCNCFHGTCPTFGLRWFSNEAACLQFQVRCLDSWMCGFPASSGKQALL